MTKLSNILTTSPRHYNHLEKCEAAVLRLNGTEQLLATAHFNMGAELQRGAFKEPYLVGWLMVVPGIKKMLTTCAIPEFVSIYFQCKQKFLSDPIYVDLIMNGVKDAALQSNVHVTDMELVPANEPFLRSHFLGKNTTKSWVDKEPCKEGHVLYASGKMGNGNLYAFQSIHGVLKKHSFRPFPNYDMARLIRTDASSCLSTYRGFFRTLADFSLKNSCGLTIELSIDDLLDEVPRKYASKDIRLKEFFLAGPYGEYEFIFSVSPERETDFIQKANRLLIEPLRLGVVTDGNTIVYSGDSKRKTNNALVLSEQCPTAFDSDELQGIKLKHIFH